MLQIEFFMAECKQGLDKLADQLADQLTCVVCLSEFTRPRVLTCLHVFCEDCLQGLVESEGNKRCIVCPTCRQCTELTKKGVSSLPFAFHIQKTKDMETTLQVIKSSGRGAGKTSCSVHPREPVEIYCDTCNMLICRECALKKHKAHAYDFIPEAFVKHKDAIDRSLEPLKRHLSNIADTISTIDDRSQKFEECHVSCKERLDTEIDHLHELLEARRTELHSEMDNKAEEVSNQLETQREQQRLSQIEVSSCVEFVERALNSGTQEKVLSMKNLLLERAQQTDKEFDPKPLNPEVKLHLAYADLSSACRTLGKVSFKFQPFQGTHMKTIYGVRRPHHVAIAAGGEMVVCEREANCVTVFDTNYKCSHLFTNEKRERVVYKKAHKRFLFFRKSRSSKSKPAPAPVQNFKLVSPKGVAISPDNSVFITAEHCVNKFTLEGRFLGSVGSSQGNGRLQFNTPYAIAYNSTNNKLYVCDTNNCRITVLDLDLSFHDCFGNEGYDPGQFKYPIGICIDRKGNVLVADPEINAVQIFTMDGHFLSSIKTALGVQLNKPSSVATGPDGFVYVIEFTSDRVLVFDRSLHHFKTFGRKGDRDGEFNDPYCITVSKNNVVFVSDTYNNRIQLFK